VVAGSVSPRRSSRITTLERDRETAVALGCDPPQDAVHFEICCNSIELVQISYLVNMRKLVSFADPPDLSVHRRERVG
jgi:hypothetical protein